MTHRPRLLSWLAGAAAVALAAAGSASAQSYPQAAVSETDMVRFLVQSLCSDAAGNPIDASPVDAACVNRRAQTADAPASYRKHDWPAAVEQGLSYGYQASDAVLSAVPGGQGDAVIVTQTFDFDGVPGGGFGRFGVAGGDGGQVIAITRGAAAVFMTQDGGAPGLQWFVGDGCSTGQRPQELAWLLFTDQVNAGGWSDAVAKLSISRVQSECPAGFSSAYTRYLRSTVAVPFLKAGVPAGDRNLDVIVSEHFDLPTVQQSNHLERFFLAKDLGMVRWERWEHLTGPNPQVEQAAQVAATSGRCPALALSSPPDQGWVMIDCRMWTNLVPPPARGWTVRQFGWEGVEARPLGSGSGARRFSR